MQNLKLIALKEVNKAGYSRISDLEEFVGDFSEGDEFFSTESFQLSKIEAKVLLDWWNKQCEDMDTEISSIER